jgi:hypothetical protein
MAVGFQHMCSYGGVPAQHQRLWVAVLLLLLLLLLQSQHAEILQLSIQRSRFTWGQLQRALHGLRGAPARRGRSSHAQSLC